MKVTILVKEPNKLKLLKDLIAPHYLLITVLTTFSSFLIINANLDAWLVLTVAIFCLSMALTAFNISNMIYDVKLDRINKPDRPIPSGKITIKQANYLRLLAFIFSIIPLVLIQRMEMLVPIAIFYFLALIYTHPQIYLKKYFFASPVFGGLLYGTIPFIVAGSVTNQEIPLSFLLLFSLMTAVIAPIKDIEDMIGEKKQKIYSIPSLIGADRTVKLIYIGLLTLVLFMSLNTYFGAIEPKYAIGNIFFGLMVLLVMMEKSLLKNKKDKHIVTQSKKVTILMLANIGVQLVYGLLSLL